MDKEFLQNQLRTIVYMLALIPLEEFEAYMKDIHHGMDMYDAVGSMLDPTTYRDNMYNGRREDADFQNAMSDKLLEVRRIIEKREAFVKGLKR